MFGSAVGVISKMMKTTIFLFLVTLTLPKSSRAQEEADWGDTIDESFDDMEEVATSRSTVVAEMARQIMYDRYMNEERIRSEGGSGLVGVRNYKTGGFNYHSASYTSRNDFASLHDHPSYFNIAGMGEASLSMNGIHFRTKHTNYQLRRPHRTSTAWHATEAIEPPPIPSTIDTSAPVEDQVAEMQEYFRAFNDQNITHRDYRNFFKPVLCYIEGKWLADTSKIEPFGDEDDNIAYEFQDLISQARLASYLGSNKRHDHTVPTLPRTMIGLNSDGYPIYAQWHYRVLCYPFTMEDIPLKNFRLVDDLAYRVPNNIDIEELQQTRAARFIIDEASKPGYHEESTLLDKLVAKIPGLDNVPDDNSILESQWLGRKTQSPEGEKPDLNRGYYNHIFWDYYRDPYRVNAQLRGFGDVNLYVAHTTQEEVAAVPIHYSLDKEKSVNFDNMRVSWMLPLEVVYMSPLSNWNPHNINYYPGDTSEYPAKSVKEVDRDGSVNKPFNGTNSYLFMRTPSEFFKRIQVMGYADSWTGFKSILNADEEVKLVAASGAYTLTPEINNDVGQVRLRYPILPLHKETDPVWKELNAYKTFVTTELKNLALTFKEAGIRV